MTHFPRSSDSGTTARRESGQITMHTFGNIAGFVVSASPKGHETVQAEAGEQHLRATKWVWQQQLPTGMGCGGPDAEMPPSFIGCRV